MHSHLIAFLFGLLTAAQSTAHAQEIYKCIVDGKTLYSDQTCPKKSERKPVALHHAGGVVSPDRDTVTDAMNRLQDENWVNAVPGRSITRTTTRQGKTTTSAIDNPLPQQASSSSVNKKSVCDAISARIEYLDAMARQPQSASTQDWIKQEKAKKQSEQFDLKC